MKKPFSLLVALSLLSSFTFTKEPVLPTDISQVHKPQTLKALLCDKEDSIFLELSGGYKVYDPQTGLLISEEKKGRAAPLTLNKGFIHWKETNPGLKQIRIVPVDSTILVNGIQYKGCLEIYEIGGKLAAVNEIDIENFLKSSLPHRNLPSMGPEILNALAIVERTNLYALASQKKVSWHLSAKNTHYHGSALRFQNNAMEKAIEDTRYVVLTLDDKPFATCWNVDNAGTSACYNSIYRKNGPSTSASFLEASQKTKQTRKWSFTLTKEQIASIFKFPAVKTIDLFVDKTTSKVYGVKITHADSFESLDFFSFQKKIGASLKSNDFTIKKSKKGFTFEGYGEGSGVGLCLYSANMLGQTGKTAPYILKTFYPEAKLQSVYSLR